MLMVVTLHFLSKGGSLNESILSGRYNVAWALEGICIVAVNCYVLLSGYFLVTSRFRWSKVWALIAQVLFYSLGVYGVLLAIGKVTFQPDAFFISLFPILTGQYWFISAYIGLYLLSPFLNVMIQNLKQRQHLLLAVALVALFSVWPTLFWQYGVEGYKISNGYSITWFITLYVVASYIRLYVKPTYRTLRHLVMYGAAGMVVPILSYALSFYIVRAGGSAPNLAHFRDSLFMYNSFPVLLASVMLFLLFANWRLTNRAVIRVVKFLAPLTFGVYLLHEHPFLIGWIWYDLKQVPLYSQHFMLYAVMVIGGIYLAGSLVDYMRIKLFALVASRKVGVQLGAYAKRCKRAATRQIRRIRAMPQIPLIDEG